MHRHIYIFDFDGTLADIEHRVHHVRNGNRRWKEFFAECPYDIPKWDVIQVLTNLVWNGAEVEIWSGRSDEVRKESEIWLDKYLGALQTHDGRYIAAHSLLTRMRPENDDTKDFELKRSWLKEIQANGDKVLGVFDDRQQVVDMWREEKLTCFQVAPGDFDKPKAQIINTLPTLRMMIGPSGAGKSTYIEKNLSKNAVVSTDTIREQIWGDRNSPEAFTKENFAKPHQITHLLVRHYLEMGMDVVHDATNIKPADRKKLFKDLHGVDYQIEYIIVDRPLDEKIATIGPQKKEVVERHHQTFKQNYKSALSGDGNPFVVSVIDARKV